METSAPALKRVPAPAAPRAAPAAAEPNGSEILVRCLQAENVQLPLGLPRRRGPLHLRRALQAGDDPARPGPPRAGARCTPPTAMRGRPARSASRWSPPAPGVTNAVTGIATAYMDSIPMVIITGQVPTPAIGLDAFQECDTVGITRPIVKHNFLVKDVRDLAIDDQEGVPHRPHRPARARSWSTCRRTCRWRRRRSTTRRPSRCARTTR